MDIQDLLEKADRELFKVRSVDTDCPLSKIIPKKKETNYNRTELSIVLKLIVIAFRMYL